MYEYHTYSNYDLHPMTTVKGYDGAVISGYDAICREIQKCVGNREKTVVVCDLYPGVKAETIADGLAGLKPALTVFSDNALFPYEKLDDIFRDYLSDDRVFAYMTSKEIKACFDKEKLKTIAEEIDETECGIILVIGCGASLITAGDISIYFDLNRWECQFRYRRGDTNWLADNPSDAVLAKVKRGYFIEWRLADKHKDKLFHHMDYIVDTNNEKQPKMIPAEAFFAAMDQASHKPFRMEPYFDPGVWGGQWMKHVCSLPPEEENYAWSFDGVPEENCINLKFGDDFVSLPMMDMILTYPEPFLGAKNIARFGREFPIRFDFLDTMDGQNLSLQVHPLTEYIQKTFGMHYTQDESYYILDAKENSCVYIGLKEGVDKDEMKRDLERAQKGEIMFPAEKYVNKVPVKKHDHILIPAGTVHCSGADTMVLEISATPYIFTFKLWDWGRVGLDGLPRPIHIEHGMNNIQFNRTTEWVMNNLVHQEKTLECCDGYKKEHTGLHSLEFIETERYTTDSSYSVTMGDSMHVCNLVDGKEAVIESFDGEFEPFTVHYAETFIIPSSVKRYKVKSAGGEIKVITAFVRN